MANVLETTFSVHSTSSERVQALSGDSVRLSVVIPMYNQEKNAHDSLARINKVLNSLTISYELVIVDDGSTDGTLSILHNEASTDNHIRVITYSKNMGKGYAVRTGVLGSQGDLVLFTDGDLDISPHVITEYIRELENCDLVIASKTHPHSRVDAPLSRKLLSKAFNFIVRILTGIEMRDTQSGLKAGKGNALRRIFRIMLVKRYAFDVELLTIASALKLKMKELPIEIRLDRRFRIGDIIRMFVDVIAISYRYWLRGRYQKAIAEDFKQSIT